MLEINSVMSALHQSVAEKAAKYGFTPVFPEGVKANELPLKTRTGDACFIDYAGEKGKLRLLYSEGKIFLLLGDADAEDSDDTAFKKLSTNLLILEEYSEKDVKSAANEICETLDDNFGVKELARKTNKMPATVSKNAVKSGASSYDPITLVSRIVGVYPELKAEMTANMNTYGELLAEDFFVNHANRLILATIQGNDERMMKKLFNQLCELFDNGTNETQNLIAVTVLGAIENDPGMMKNIMPYLSDSMVEPVCEVNRILGKSKSARMRLQNPPKYKPKKKKAFAAPTLGQ